MVSLKIGKLAKRSGCSIQAIRHYEKEGLLSSFARSEGNFRLYDQYAEDRLLFIKRCRSLDLSLLEVKHLLELSQSPEMTCSEVNVMVEQHIQQVEKRLVELRRLRQQLLELRENCSQDRTVEQCGIIKNLAKPLI